MSTRRIRAAVIAAALLALLAAASPSYGQAFPNKPIEFIVPFGAGGGSDILARTIARIMAEERFLTVPITVVNKPGGSGAVGWAEVLNKRGDPHVLTTVSGSFWTTPLVGQAPFKPTDFTPVAGIARDTFFFVVRAESTYRSMRDVVGAAKQSVGTISVGGSAVASDDRVVTALLEKEAGIKLNYIPFGGSGPALTALLGGHVSSTWLNPGEALEQIKANKVRALAVTDNARLKVMPGVPTFRELGYDVVWQQYRGVAMAPGVPAEALRVMANAFQRLCRSTRWQRDYVEANILVPACEGPEDFARTVATVTERYRRVFTELGIIKG
jgi:putative tricarboxylic transport membrane protein